MNNTNINTILEAVGELDNSVLENAFKPRKKKPIALIVIAAAAAVSLLVGFTAAHRNYVALNGEPLFEYNIKIHDEVIIPPLEEMKTVGAVELEQSVEDHGYIYYIQARPSEVIKKYNLTPMINDNFSEEINIDNYPDLLLNGIYQTYVSVPQNMNFNGSTASFLHFRYFLIDKQNGLPVDFTMMCHIVEPKTPLNRRFKAEEGNFELIELNTGEKAYVEQTFYTDKTSSYAAFTYDGIVYSVSADTDLAGMKQILADLGITKPNFDYYKQDGARILTADELIALGAEGDSRGYTLTAVPSELFAKYNVAPIMNAEYFAEERSEITVQGASSGMAIIDYTLTDKESGKPISVKAQFFVNGESSFGFNFSTIDGKPSDAFNHCETLCLADGSEVFVADRYSRLISGYNAHAVFCCDGVGYKLIAKNTDINEMKQILKNLGITE